MKRSTGYFADEFGRSKDFAIGCRQVREQVDVGKVRFGEDQFKEYGCRILE